MEDFSIKRLTREDLALQREALSLYSEVFEDPGSYSSRPPDDAYLQNLLDRSDFIQLVALSGQRMAGALSAYVLPKFEQARSEIYIYDLAVREDFRRRGIAQSLIEALGPIARQSNGWVVFVQADHGDDPAIALYDKLGTREEVLHFDLDVVPR